MLRPGHVLHLHDSVTRNGDAAAGLAARKVPVGEGGPPVPEAHAARVPATVAAPKPVRLRRASERAAPGAAS